MKSTKALLCLFIFLACVSTVANSQTLVNRGMKFEDDLNWDQILRKAKAEDKFIFVDFYATWCGPCKQMDEDIYSLDSVGKLTNDHFISVRIQVDKTESDGKFIKEWYGTSDSLVREYQIKDLPALIFLSPDNVLIGKEQGLKSGAEFIGIMNAVIHEKSGYIDSVLAYRNGKLPYAGMGKLALEAKSIGDKNLGSSLSSQFKMDYLDKLKDSGSLITKDNIDFCISYYNLIHPNDRIFKFFYNHPKETDSVIGIRMGVAMEFVKYIVMRDEIQANLYNSEGKVVNPTPDWRGMGTKIKSEYGLQFCTDLIKSAQMDFYKRTGDWKRVANLIDRKIRLTPPTSKSSLLGGPFGDLWFLDENAWNIFLHCNDKAVLKRALKWIDTGILLWGSPGNFQFIDTKANILYKLGKQATAIQYEEEAYGLTKNDRGIASTLNKMKQGVPTWDDQ
jgi:thioredoxin-related protein